MSQIFFQVVDQPTRALLASCVPIEAAVEVCALLREDQPRPAACGRLEFDGRKRYGDAFFVDLHRVAVDDTAVRDDVVVARIEFRHAAAREFALDALAAADAELHLAQLLLPLAGRPSEPGSLRFRIRPCSEYASRRKIERALDRKAAVLDRARAAHARCSFGSAITIQPTPKRSASMPKLGE